MYEVIIEHHFSSAHFLRDYKGADEPLHGHNWKVQARFRGKTLAQPEQYLVDFVETLDLLKKVCSKIDYKNINDVPPFSQGVNPSAENIARWIFDEMARQYPVAPSCVTVWETEAGAASYLPD